MSGQVILGYFGRHAVIKAIEPPSVRSVCEQFARDLRQADPENKIPVQVWAAIADSLDAAIWRAER